MTLVELVRRYQSFDPATGTFTVTRSGAAYAALLGINASVLSRFYSGDRRNSYVVLRAFMRTFPQAADAVALSMQQAEVA